METSAHSKTYVYLPNLDETHWCLSDFIDEDTADSKTHVRKAFCAKLLIHNKETN